VILVNVTCSGKANTKNETEINHLQTIEINHLQAID